MDVLQGEWKRNRIKKVDLLFDFIVASVSHELAYNVNWYREDNCTVLLRRNTVQCLKVAQL